MIRTRFAPSPTGLLHLGHAYSALENARIAGPDGTMLLRIEDLDRDRCRPEFETAIYEDLHWLGLDWPRPVRRQSEHLGAYAEGLDRLAAMGLLYPCRCQRRDIRAAMPADPRIGPDGPVYPGTCRGRPMSQAGPGDALRLDIARATDGIAALHVQETGPQGTGCRRLDPALFATRIGDVVLRRRASGQPAYHLAVTLDDAQQGVTHVVRGQDLTEATAIHVLLQYLLDLPVPIYHHHALIRDETGTRLAKSHNSRAIAAYRAAGDSPADLRARIAAQLRSG